ncbi:MAG: peptidylprolyl isomerase [Cardiobacteriaceae bacterium]|nr:peptidylprolyl isomerase [Cardiobacteriaceae bacterium]
MKISQNTVVTISYKLSQLQGPQNRFIPAQNAQMSYLHGGYHGILPRVEQELEGKQVGDKIELELQPSEHFGEYNPELIRTESKADMPNDIAVGVVLEGHNPVTGQVILFHILEINEDTVKIDGNHPLAGKTIRFEATVDEVRAASEDEVAHGHAHGAHGHHH